MKRLVLAVTMLLLMSLYGDAFARDDNAGQLVQAGFGLLSGVVNSVQKSQANKQQSSQVVRQEAQTNVRNGVNNNVQTPTPSFTGADISLLLSKIKTNLKNDEVMEIMNSPFHLIALQSPDIKFGQLFCLCGEGQLSLDQKRRIFGNYVVDPKGKWQCRITGFNKTNEDTLAIEMDLLMRNDPTESPTPKRRILYFRYNPGDMITLIQMKAFGTNRGDLQINNDAASGYLAEQIFASLYEGLGLFLSTGQYQFNGN